MTLAKAKAGGVHSEDLDCIIGGSVANMTQFGKLILSLSNGQEQEFLLEKSAITLGRSATSDITLSDAKVSRVHARLQCNTTDCTLTDLGSANGIRVNGVAVERALLAPGDVIGLGDSTLRFVIDTPAFEPEIMAIDSEADLDATLAQATVPMTLTNTDLPRLAIHTPDRTWEVLLTQESLTIGRHTGSDLLLDQAKASRHHARIERVGDGFRLRDLGSTNGTWLGSQRIDARLLRHGDTIRIGDARLVFKAGFGLEDLTLVEEQRRLTDLTRTLSRPPVVFVPGMMGSQLWRGNERLWPDVKRLFTQPEIYRFQADQGFQAHGIVGEVVVIPNLIKQQQYSRLGDYLEEALGYQRGQDLLEFAYDFRQDNRISAQQLAMMIDHWQVAPPITLIAHSLGCLVSRYYVERLGGKQKVGRLILLGGPHNGFPKAVSNLLVGPDFLPFGLMSNRMRDVLATFPSMYQTLPINATVVDQEGRPIDLFADERWLPAPQRPFLREAKAFRHELGLHSSVPTVSIFGYGLKTISSIQVQRDAEGRWQKVDFVTQDSGDASIPEASAVLAGSEIHPVQQHHGALYVDSDVKMRLKLELTK